MKRINDLWPRITGIDNLYAAWLKARLGKRSRPAVTKFGLQLESELFALQAELGAETYQPGAYRLFTIYERRPRQIAAAPFRDRVVHHAIMAALEPALDPSFIEDSYACRRNKGVHRAVDRYQQWCRRYRYALKIDIAAYFASIDHCLLKNMLAHRLKEPPLLRLLDTIIDNSPVPTVSAMRQYFPGDDLLTPVHRRRGIPIGNLTSQFFANFYLDGLDHFIKQELKAKAYLRYVDDMILLADHKATLWQWHKQITNRLEQLRLTLHPRKCHLTPTTRGLDVLGYRVFPGHRELRNDNGHRFARRLRGMARHWANREANFDDFRPTVASWVGHAQHADTRGLLRETFAGVQFRRTVA